MDSTRVDEDVAEPTPGRRSAEQRKQQLQLYAATVAAALALVAAVVSAVAALWALDRADLANRAAERANELAAEANEIAKSSVQAIVSAELIPSGGGRDRIRQVYCDFDLRVWNSGGAGAAIDQFAIELRMGDESVAITGSGMRGFNAVPYPATRNIGFAGYAILDKDSANRDFNPDPSPESLLRGPWNLPARTMTVNVVRVHFWSDLPSNAFDDWPTGQDTEQYKQWLAASKRPSPL